MSKPLQVYLVEDSQIVQRLLTSSIAAAGAQVNGCSGDAEAAIADVFALQPDVVVIDIALHSGSGLDVLKALNERSFVPGSTKIVLTNHATVEYRKACSLLGADRFFDKSIEMAQALALIGAIAAQAHHVSSAARGTSQDPTA